MVVFSATPGGNRENSSHLCKQHLSPGRMRLVELMQRINFGRIERLMVTHGEPVFSSDTKTVRAYKLKGENGPRPELATADFLLKQDVVELFAFFGDLQNGEIDRIEIKHGLPFLIEVTEAPA